MMNAMSSKPIVAAVITVIGLIIVLFFVLLSPYHSSNYEMISASQAASVLGGKWTIMTNASGTVTPINSTASKVSFANGTTRVVSDSSLGLGHYGMENSFLVPNSQLLIESLAGINTTYGNMTLFVFKYTTPNSTFAESIFNSIKSNFSEGSPPTTINGYNVYTTHIGFVIGIKGNQIVLVAESSDFLFPNSALQKLFAYAT
ncbi:MAG: hypothetical protein ARM1_0628 [Candidatus Micrarchaeota archaeon]|nr:MAG: hypothetical protein ARM1_0628 [Candidatus Micrarchaeota archaeon]